MDEIIFEDELSEEVTKDFGIEPIEESVVSPPERPITWKHIDFIPDKTSEIYFPWDDVMACINNTIEPTDPILLKKCPKCKKPASELWKILFVSPPWTWEELCGRQGPMSLCPNCGIQVAYLWEEES